MRPGTDRGGNRRDPEQGDRTNYRPPSPRPPIKRHTVTGSPWITFPIVTVVIEPENVDLSRYVKIGEEHTRTLEMKPGYLYVKDTVRPTYALKNEMEAVDNGEKAVITAPMPLTPIYKGMPRASMLAEVLLQTDSPSASSKGNV